METVVGQPVAALETFQPTERKEFWFGTELVVLEVENSTKRFAWRLTAGQIVAGPTLHYSGILRAGKYIVATAFWEGILPVMVPVKLTPPVGFEGG